jgi:uncharacterized protein (DUF305 family)
MKRTIRTILIASAVIAIGCNQNNKPSSQSDSTNHHQSGTHQQGNKNLMMQSMDGNMADMHAIKLTGNPDYDFAAMMIPHHEAAVSMSMALLKKTKNQEFINFGLGVIDAQRGEIKQLKAFLETAPTSPIANAETFKKDIVASMDKMMVDMGKIDLEKPVDSFAKTDRDYTLLMVPHHQSAVDMAKVYLPYAKNSGIKKIAEGVVAAQEKEIEWLNKQVFADPSKQK